VVIQIEGMSSRRKSGSSVGFFALRGHFTGLE